MHDSGFWFVSPTELGPEVKLPCVLEFDVVFELESGALDGYDQSEM